MRDTRNLRGAVNAAATLLLIDLALRASRQLHVRNMKFPAFPKALSVASAGKLGAHCPERLGATPSWFQHEVLEIGKEGKRRTAAWLQKPAIQKAMRASL